MHVFFERAFYKSSEEIRSGILSNNQRDDYIGIPFTYPWDIVNNLEKQIIKDTISLFDRKLIFRFKTDVIVIGSRKEIYSFSK